ncbi:chemotaxis protein CheX [Sporomusaceae bacterium FL31]|nr:chemotaxis protein CheX [Sporomusaceae bacterium FL31]GCE35574.1 chemotaxis protein CheX [Sporomusaceae bacterium]
MDVKLINPFVDAVATVMPQLGFQNISRGKLALKEQYVSSQGVTVLIGMTNQVRGNIAYNMSEETAKSIASVMMMGMPVDKMDEIAQSAISEMVNMVTANAAINFEKQGMNVDISPPSLALGEDFKIKVSSTKYLALELMVDSNSIELNIGLGL